MDNNIISEETKIYLIVRLFKFTHNIVGNKYFKDKRKSYTEALIKDWKNNYGEISLLWR